MKPQRRVVAFVVAVLLAIGLSGWAVYVGLEESNDRASENRLLFKFSCEAARAVAERLDTLVRASAENPSHTKDALEKFEQYHQEFQRGKDICPPITREESRRLMEILVDLGGKPPDAQPGR